MVCSSSSSVCSIGFCSLLTLVLALLLSFSFFIICAVKIEFFFSFAIIITQQFKLPFCWFQIVAYSLVFPLFLFGHVLRFVCTSICGHPYGAKVWVCYQMFVCVSLSFVLRGRGGFLRRLNPFAISSECLPVHLLHDFIILQVTAWNQSFYLHIKF